MAEFKNDGKLTSDFKNQWGVCRKGNTGPDNTGPIGRVVGEASVTWKGDGAWTPGYFCFCVEEGSAGEKYYTTCKPKPEEEDRLPLQKDQIINLDCEHDDGWMKCDDDETGWKQTKDETLN